MPSDIPAPLTMQNVTRCRSNNTFKWRKNSQLVAAKHYLQLRDEQFDRASVEVTHPTTKTLGEGHNACATEQTEKPTKAKNPEKLNVFRGSAAGFVPLRERKMGAEGLEPPTPSV